MGNCSYLLAKPCNTTLAPPFAVYADNENRYNVLSVSYLKAVHVHTLGVVVSILKGGVVQVRQGAPEWQKQWEHQIRLMCLQIKE